MPASRAVVRRGAREAPDSDLTLLSQVQFVAAQPLGRGHHQRATLKLPTRTVALVMIPDSYSWAGTSGNRTTIGL